MKIMLSNSSHGTTKNGLIARTMFGKVKNSKLKRRFCHLIDKVELTKKSKMWKSESLKSYFLHFGVPMISLNLERLGLSENVWIALNKNVICPVGEE